MGPAPKGTRYADVTPTTRRITIQAGQATGSTANIGRGSLASARVTATLVGPADATATAILFATGNSDGTVTVTVNAAATAPTNVDVTIDPTVL